VKKSNTSHQLRVLVVGDSCDEFIRFVMSVLCDYSVDFEHVTDVYQAMGRLAKNAFEDGVVVGRFEELGLENGRFFEKAGEMSLECCCFAAADFSKQAERVSIAGGGHVSVITETQQLERMLAGLFAGGSVFSADRKVKDSSDFSQQRFITTEAERKALLELVD